MAESFPARLKKTVEDHLATSIGLSLAGLFSAAWGLYATEIFKRMYLVLEDRGTVALILGLVASLIWCAIGWRAERKKEKPLYDRLVPVPESGYSVDPKTKEAACPKCVSNGHLSFMRKLERDGHGYYQCYACYTSIHISKV